MDQNPHRSFELFPLELTHAIQDGQLRFQVAGELDMMTSEEFAAAVAAVIRTAEVRSLIVDMAGVTFLSSSGISALIQIYRLASERHIDMRVVHCSPRVATVLQITGVYQILTGPQAA